jgi:acyl-CoA reductase-like NAD-dependent aldehyde dehydrogenase
MIVLASARDLDAVASYALWGRFANSGQTCAAVKRLLVHERHYDGLLRKLVEKVGQLRLGLPEDPATHLGPLISEDQLSRLTYQIEDARDRGAQIVTGGARVKDQNGFYFQPTVLRDVPNDARVIKEEVFGPVLPVQSFSQTDEAIELANQSRFGLTASVFGHGPELKGVSRQLVAGVVGINEVPLANYAISSVPWGGCKDSGPGWSHGKAGFEEVTRMKIVTHNLSFQWPALSKPLWFFPKQTADVSFIRTLIGVLNGRPVGLAQLRTFVSGLWQNRASHKL